MLVLRFTKISLVAAIALFASIVAFGNITDYDTNFEFVRHVLTMDTTFPHSNVRYRAINAPFLHHAAYASIIATEAAIGALCWIGAWKLAGVVRGPAADFNRAKSFACAGLGLGLMLWQVGFITIGGEWFSMWQSSTWNGVPSAFRFVVMIGMTLILVALPDSDLKAS